MPRRPPPTSLRLIKGPLPGRGKAKHTLPSVPRPVHVPSDVSRTISRAAPEPRPVAGASADTVYARQIVEDANSSQMYRQPRRRSVERGLDTSGLAVSPTSSSPARGVMSGATNGSGMLNRAAPSSSSSISPMTTPSPGSFPMPPPMRGPWDHSRAVSLPIDVGSMLALPKPVAISP